MRFRVARRMLALLSLGSLACSDPGEPGRNAAGRNVSAAATTEGLRLTNPTDRTIYYAAFERDWATRGLFIWAQCTDAPRCPSVKPRETVTIPFSEIGGHTPAAREALVYYWTLTPTSDGGYQASAMQNVVVPF